MIGQVNHATQTSFAKTFEKIQERKVEEIRDEVFEIQGHAHVYEDGETINPAKIFVIHSYEGEYQADITPLLLNESLKSILKEVLNYRDTLFKKLEKMSGLKIKKISSGKVIYELETQIIDDFGFEENSFLVNLSQIDLDEELEERDISHIKYSDIFDPAVLSKILSSEFQSKIADYIIVSDRIYQFYGFLEKGKLTLPKLKEMRKNLEKNSYFVNENGLILCGKEIVSDYSELDKVICEIEEAVKNVPEMRAVEQLLNDVKGRTLRDIIEVRPDILRWLTPDNLPKLRIIMWKNYLNNEKKLFIDLLTKYQELANQVAGTTIDNTEWHKALQIYKKRFSVPYDMEVTNLKGVVIGESVPRISFGFNKNGEKVSLSKERLDEINILSQGEKRALYLLNIIFEVEKRKQMGTETIFVIDDIADSFDYKNKYAIVEYLRELSLIEKFRIIILSHNFDFFRTITSRLNVPNENCLTVDSTCGLMALVSETYHNDPFKEWKKNLNYHKMIAMIPLARNVIEYGKERNIVNSEKSDKKILTNLLHEKEESNEITFETLYLLYKEYLGVTEETTFDLAVKVLDMLENISNGVNLTTNKLEDKIILAIAIRHKAEKYMIQSINQFNGEMAWYCRRKKKMETGNSEKFLKYVKKEINQTNRIFEGFKQICTDFEMIRLMEEVNIITPENIHLNSFMYEPILDMDINELLNLYQTLKSI